jgi:hypothetical protein
MLKKFCKSVILAALVLTLGISGSALAESNSPVNFRGVGGAVMGGTWNIAFTGIGKLLNEKYPGSNVNVILGAAVSNPLKIEANGGDVTCTQSFNIVNGLKGNAPYKKPLTQLASIANINDVTVVHLVVGKSVDANSLEEIVEKKIPIRLDPGQKGTLHYILGEMLLKELGASYADIQKWGGKVMPVSGADRCSMMQDGTINACFVLGSLQQAQLQEMVVNSGIRWLTVKPEALKAVAEKANIQIATIPASLYNGAVGRDVPALMDTVHMICRKDMSEEDVYKITKVMAEGAQYLHEVLPAWESLNPADMPTHLVAPLHPGAERYYREAGLLK